MAPHIPKKYGAVSGVLSLEAASIFAFLLSDTIWIDLYTKQAVPVYNLFVIVFVNAFIIVFVKAFTHDNRATLTGSG